MFVPNKALIHKEVILVVWKRGGFTPSFEVVSRYVSTHQKVFKSLPFRLPFASIISAALIKPSSVNRLGFPSIFMFNFLERFHRDGYDAVLHLIVSARWKRIRKHYLLYLVLELTSQFPKESEACSSRSACCKCFGWLSAGVIWRPGLIIPRPMDGGICRPCVVIPSSL